MIGGSDPSLESAATIALRGAVSMLSDPGCRQVFTEFSDRSGVSLQARLDALGHTPESYLRQLRFTNGRGLRACQWTHVLAATMPNSRVILLCGAQFSRRGRIAPRHAAALLIHEELHSLGLGENPPSSQYITARVLQLCGRRGSLF